MTMSDEQCPACEVRLPADDVRGQMAHMESCHPEVIAERRREAARWDGWEE